MRSSRRTQALRRTTFIAVVVATTAAAFTAGSGAQEAPAADPATPVSSDGSTLDIVPTGDTFSRSVRGTGETAAATTVPAGPEGAPATGSGAETVIGVDNRVQVTDTTKGTPRKVVSINMMFGASSFICSGWLISQDTVATAGHCVHQGGGGVFATNVIVRPGRNGALAPYGTCNGVGLYTVNGWSVNGLPTYDYGAIKLDCNVGLVTGWFGLKANSGDWNGTETKINGYPGDKPAGTQWKDDNKVRDSQARQLFYKNDTFGGQSGAPVFKKFNGCGKCGFAIHAYGVGGGSPFNGGTRVIQEVFNFFQTIIALP